MKHVPILIAAALLAVCADASAASTPTTAQLEARTWQLTRATDAGGRRISALFVRGREPYTLRFGHGYMSELNLCNNVSSQYRLQGNQLILENGIQTVAGCMRGDIVVQQERAGKLMGSRSAAPTLELDDRGALVLRNAQGDTTVFEPAPLPVK
ncbi:META domain-containing protein [Stenotrophomonas maltophilia]|uniref:META domain-containing protein n=1 Tax=Stenotrophomonas maltophilia TaxID=40324 RepID=UPI002894C3ED|nr:META domain-containing protein [Stenotrophomonas maltophilia]MDT3486399.1 META domain-containing protein [Stenotrophomonas maltophilia]